MKREDVQEMVEKVVKNIVNELIDGCECKEKDTDTNCFEKFATIMRGLEKDEVALIIKPENIEDFTEDVIKKIYENFILEIPNCTMTFITPIGKKVNFFACHNDKKLDEEKISVEESDKEEEEYGEMKFGFISSDEPSIGEMIQDIIDNRSDEVKWEFTVKK